MAMTRPYAKRRSEFEQFIDLLIAVERYPGYSRSRVVNIAGLATALGCDMLIKMCEEGLVKLEGKNPNPRGSRYVSLTMKGKKWLNQARELRAVYIKIMNSRQYS